jgi:hypothetical protein
VLGQHSRRPVHSVCRRIGVTISTAARFKAVAGFNGEYSSPISVFLRIVEVTIVPPARSRFAGIVPING